MIDKIIIQTDQKQRVEAGGGGGNPHHLHGKILSLSGEVGGDLPCISRLTVRILTEQRHV
ncbi:hypothetical protein I6F07_19480 [Ensifer sp. IC4062]|nr:hypothetical protein [Ensifer sp. IC4062]MCA1442357.1 hypothetical protein [Ensifer sp. IC4062]